MRSIGDGEMGNGEVGRWGGLGGGEMGRWGDGELGRLGRWGGLGGGEVGRWGGGEMGRWRDEDWEMGNGRREGHNCDEQTQKPQRKIET